MRAYHGTTQNVKRFSSKRFREGHVGPAVYLTSIVDDAVNNYACVGPDLDNHIEQFIDDLMSSDWGEHHTREEAIQIAYKKFIGPGNYLLTCEISPKAKLFKLGRNYVELWTYNGEDEDAEPEFTQIGKALDDLYNQFGLDKSEVFCDSEVRTFDILHDLAHKYEDYDETSLGEVFKQFVLDAGFDGVEYEDAHDFFPFMVDSGTQHFAIYKPNLVKIVEKEEL